MSTQAAAQHAQPGTSPAAAWRRALPGLALVLLAVLLLYRQTGLAMVEIWDRSETFAHAFVVPPISLWLIWRQRAQLALLAPRPAAAFLLPLAGAALLWLLGDLAAVNAATQLAFTAMLVLSVPLCLGGPVARAIAFPLGFLFFAVPIGEFMMPQFMAWTADFTVAALRLSGIPVYREGLQFVIPSGNWSVVEACSGIRYLMASVMVGTLFAYLNYRSLRRRWIFVGFAILLPIVANWLRAYMIVMLGHLSGNQLATGADHLVYGWVFFGIIMLAMFMVGARWSEPDAQADASPVLASTGPRGGRSWLAPLLALALLAGPWAVLSLLERGQRSDAPQLRLPAPADGWTLQSAAPAAALLPPRLSPAFEAPPASLQAAYLDAQGAPLGLYIAYYRQQSYSSKLISSSNDLVNSHSKLWSRVEQGGHTLALPGLSLPLRSAELVPGPASREPVGTRLLAWQLYWINGRPLSADWQAKLLGAAYRLIGRGDDAAVLVIYTDKGESGQGRQRLERYLQDNWQTLDAALRSTRDAAPAAAAAVSAPAAPAAPGAAASSNN